MDFKDKVVFITGGTGGFGKALAKEFLSRGAKVCLGDINEEIGEQVTLELGSTFGTENVIFSICDVTNDKSFEEAYDNCEIKLGRINILINNAGFVDERNWQKCIDVSFTGTVRGCELALKKMGKNYGGVGGNVINISSNAGLSANCSFVYSAAKGGIVMLTRSLGLPFPYSCHGICYQCLCPSKFATTFSDDLTKAIPIGFGETYQKLAAAFPSISVEDVVKEVMKLLKDGKSGAVLSKTYGKDSKYIDPPNIDTMK